MLFYISTLETSAEDKTISMVIGDSVRIIQKLITEQNTSNFAIILEYETQNTMY